MKKIFMTIALCLMCAVNIFSENYYWRKVDLISTEYHPDGNYLICFDTPGGKVKVFKNFNSTVLTCNKLTDTTFVCDDSLQWTIERIENRLYSMQNNEGYYITTQYDKTEYGTLEYTTKYGLVDISSSSQIWSYYYSSGCLNIWQCISFDKTTNTFNAVTRGDGNISLYIRETGIETGIENAVDDSKHIKQLINGIVYITVNGVTYDLLGQIVN